MPPKSKSDRPRCTACSKSIKSSFDANLHPLLKTLVCRTCYSTYGTGDFSLFEDGVDHNGDDNFCRWCVDGGDLYFCGNTEQPNKCHYAFCKDCIQRNCPDDVALSIDPNDSAWDWDCLVCDTSKLKVLRKQAQTVLINLSMKDLKRTNTNSSLSIPTEEVTDSAAKRRKTDSGQQPLITFTPSKPVVVSSGRISNASSNSKEIQREPEATSMPPLEKPKPPKTSLRNLTGPKSANTPFISPRTTLSQMGTRPSLSQLDTKSASQNQSTPKPTSQQPTPSQVSSVSKSTSQALVTPKQTQPQPEASKAVSASKPAQPTTPQVSSVVNDKSGEQKSSLPQATAPKQPSTNNPSQAEPAGGQSMPQAAPLPKIPSVSKPRPVSKQLKLNNELVIPSVMTAEPPKVVLSEVELKKRFESFGSVKDRCLKEIDMKFSTILEMFETLERENKQLLRSEIGDIKRPMQEVMSMISNLEKLCDSQLV